MSDQIKVEFIGVDGNNLVYTGTANNAQLALTNLTGAPISIVPGTTAFNIVANFAELYASPSDQSQMSIGANGWNAQFEPGTYAAWRLTPAATMQWQDGATLTFAISNLTPNIAAKSCTVSVTIYNWQPFPYAVLLTVAAVAPPNGMRDLTSTFAATIAPATVNITKSQQQVITNSLQLTLRNTNPNQPLVTDPWGSAPPQFTVSFIYSPNRLTNALTTVDAANNFTFTVNGPGWTVNKIDGETGPKWLLAPTASNPQILGTGESSIITFTIGNVITEAASGPTQMYVEWSNIPGYADYNVSLLLTKNYLPVEIAQFAINDDPALGPRDVYLRWVVNNATMVQLSGVGEVPREAANYKVSIAQTTAFVLTAFDPNTGRIVSSRITARVEPSPLTEGVAPGTILMWSGPADDLPDNYVLCNGDSGTPNLCDRFVLGAGYVAPRTYAAPTHVHRAPDRVVVTLGTSEIGDHSHAFPSKWYRRLFGGGVKTRTAIDIGGWDYFGLPTQGAGKHSHTLTVYRSAQDSGANTPNMRPRWFALAYVMLRYALTENS